MIRIRTINAYFFRLYIIGLLGVFSAVKFGNLSLSFFLFPVLYLYSMILFLRLRAGVERKKMFGIGFTALFGLALSSVFCYKPLESFSSIVYLSMNVLFAYLLYAIYSLDELLNELYFVLRLLVVLGIIAFVINPAITIYVDPLERESVLGLSNFKGLFPHKIHAGVFCIIGFLLAQLHYKADRRYTHLAWMFIFNILVMLSGSSLALFSLVAILVIFPAVKWIRDKFGYYTLYFFFVTLTTIIIILLSLNMQDVILELLGRDKSLTGRTEIWDFGFQYIQQHLLLGGGLDVFFDDSPSSPAQGLWDLMPYYSAPSFHNGYIEVLAEGGLIGAVPVLILFISTYFGMIKQRQFMLAGIMTLCVIANFGAALLVKPNLFFFVFLFYCALTKSGYKCEQSHDLNLNIK